MLFRGWSNQPEQSSNTGLCYGLVEEHDHSCSGFCDRVKWQKWAAHRSWLLVWCSWCRLRTWRRCHFQLCLILSVWLPVWDTWGDGGEVGGGRWGARTGDTVRINHLVSVNTWTGARLRLETRYTRWPPAHRGTFLMFFSFFKCNKRTKRTVQQSWDFLSTAGSFMSICQLFWL